MTRLHAYGGVIGPVAFMGAWIAAAATTGRDYSSVFDAISQLAAVGADTRAIMNTGFITFGVALPLYSVALRSISGWSWLCALTTGLATLGVAALPLGVSDSVDRWHAIAAGVGYITLALTPMLACRPLTQLGHRRLAIAGVGAGLVSSVALALSVMMEADGLLQRLGLTVTDLWLIASVPVIRIHRGRDAST